MGECGQLCKLRPEISNLNIDTAIDMVLTCQIANADTLAKCAARKRAVEDALKVCAER